MSKGPVMVSAEETAKNKAFMEQMAASGTERYIRRHSKQARWTHGITIIACILLCISGLFVFVPALAAAVRGHGVRHPHVAPRTGRHLRARALDQRHHGT